MFPPLPPGLDRPMTFSSLSLPLAWLRLWSSRSGLAGHDWTAESGWSLHSSNSFACPGSSMSPEENVSSDEELYTYLSKGATMSSPAVLQDSHSLRCCKDLLEMPVYNAALCCTNLSVTSLSLSLQDRSRRTQGPKVSADPWINEWATHFDSQISLFWIGCIFEYRCMYFFSGPSNTETSATESCCHGWFSEWILSGEPITCKGNLLQLLHSQGLWLLHAAWWTLFPHSAGLVSRSWAASVTSELTVTGHGWRDRQMVLAPGALSDFTSICLQKPDSV